MSQPQNVRINSCPCLRDDPNLSCSHILPIHRFEEPPADDPQPRYPCGTCQRNISSHFKSIQCDSCNYWNHIRCDGILPYDYDKMNKLPQAEKDKIIHYCKVCVESNLPFQKLSDNEFIVSIVKNIDYKEDLNLRISPPSGLSRLFTDFSTQNEDEPLAINCDYYDTTTRNPNLKGPNLSMFHLNLAT